MVAFNKGIVDELTRKIQLPNVKITTSHAYGYGLLKQYFKYQSFTPLLNVDEYKYKNYVKKNFPDLTMGVEFEDKTDAEEFKQTVLSLVELCRFYLCETNESIENIADKYGFIVNSDHVRIIKNIINWGKDINNLDTIDFGDMVTLPNYLNIVMNNMKYDWVMVDECFPYNTTILTESGCKPIGRLYSMYVNNETLPLIGSWNVNRQKVEYKKLTNVWKRDERKILKISLGTKRHIRVTENEKLLTPDGWYYAKDLKISDYLLSTISTQPYHQFPNNDQLSLIKGCLLGDGSLHRLSLGIYRMSFVQGKPQSKYLKWKAWLLNRRSNVTTFMGGFSKTELYRVNSCGYCISEDNINIERVINNLNIKEFAIAYQDDGSFNKKTKTMSLYSVANNKKYVILLSQRINELFNISSAKQCEYKSSSTQKPYYFIRISQQGDCRKISKLIAPYVHKNLEYKLCEEDRGGVKYQWDNKDVVYGGMTITNIELEEKKEIVYDIEVEDNHNFILPSRYCKCKSQKYTGKAKYGGFVAHNCQDLSIAQQELVKRASKKNNATRFLYVGDSSQCIQSFAGSSDKSFQIIKSLPNTISLPLSINYRCPNFVESIAKCFVPEFEVFNKQKPGVIKENVLVKDIKDNSMVICRKTQPLIQLFLRLLKSGRKCYIQGFDIGGSIIETVEKLDMPYVSADFSKDGVIPQLYRELLDYRTATMKKYKIDMADASSETTFQRKLEMINTISALSEDTDNTYELIDRCKKIFRAKDAEGICLITNHKAKGLENDVVYHLCPSLLPDKRAKKDWEIQTERNLEYVLYTRTKNEFYTVSEEDFPPPQGSKDVKELITYLNGIAYQLKKLYSGEPSETVKRANVKKPTGIIPIIETENSGEIYIAQNNLAEKVMQKKKEENNTIRKFERIMTGKSVNDCYDIFNDFGITSDIQIATVRGVAINGVFKAKKDTIHVDVDNEFDNVVTKVIRIGK
jgi:hypothetical protein